jgi:hypothetical protein
MTMHRYILNILFLLFLLIFVANCTNIKKMDSYRIQEPIQIDGNLSDWPTIALSRSSAEEFDIAVTNDDEFVYISVNFRNNRIFQLARDYGLRVYFDSDRKFRRSFGIVYPVGLVNGLMEYPGAVQSYIENPGWRNIPDNRNLIEALERDLHTQVQVIRRRDKNDPIRVVDVPMDQLRADDIDAALVYDPRRMTIEFKLPIKADRSRPFGVDQDGNNSFILGFEIVAPDYTDVTGESPTYETVDSSGDGRYRNNRGGGRTQMTVSNPRLYALLNVNYQQWIQVRLK